MLRVLVDGAFVLVLLTFCGCPGGVGLRPDGTPGPEGCSAEALRTMEALQLQVGDSVKVQLDANQVDASPVTLYDGPVESLVWEFVRTLDLGTRLYGRVWTAGDRVVVRYYQAQRMGGQRFPICAVARMSGNEFRKLPGSKPGMALVQFSTAVAYIVDEFR